MYFPYFRGKQYELLLLREKASYLSNFGKIIPIIEPVKRNLKTLDTCINVLEKESVNYVLVMNPKQGELENNPEDLKKAYLQKNNNSDNRIFGYSLTETSEIPGILNFMKEYSDRKIALIHDGFSKSQELANNIKQNSDIPKVTYNIFIEQHAQKRYQHALKDIAEDNILIRDGFKKRKSNKEYHENEHFSELHLTYKDEAMSGFGDFLIVGDEYSISGGPAYAVAIHITYTDENQENDMFINHYLSNSNETIVNPAGKFLEALDKLVKDIEKNDIIQKTDAIKEFIALHNRKHFPGLGYVKKLSMQHHLEVIENFLKEL